jgi:hypothetical protein
MEERERRPVDAVGSMGRSYGAGTGVSREWSRLDITLSVNSAEERFRSEREEEFLDSDIVIM